MAVTKKEPQNPGFVFKIVCSEICIQISIPSGMEDYK